VVGKFTNNNNRDRQTNMWKTFAVYSGATFQLATSIVVFGFFGHFFAQKWNMPWLTVAGVVLGVLVGATGLAFLAKRILGENDHD